MMICSHGASSFEILAEDLEQGQMQALFSKAKLSLGDGWEKFHPNAPEGIIQHLSMENYQLQYQLESTLSVHTLRHLHFDPGHLR